MIVYMLGLYSILRSHLLMLTIFAVGDTALTVMCLLSTHHGQHVGNLGALAVFATVAALSFVAIWQLLQHRLACHSLTIQGASVNCYQNETSEDWFDFDTNSLYGLDDKEELVEEDACQHQHHHHQPHHQGNNNNNAVVGCCQQLDGEESDERDGSGTAAAAATTFQGFTLPPGDSSTFCTIETNEERYLHGKRYAV